MSQCFIKVTLQAKDTASRDILSDYIHNKLNPDEFEVKCNEIKFEADWVDNEALNNHLLVMSTYIDNGIIYATDFDSFGEIKLIFKNEQWIVAPQLPIFGKAIPFEFNLDGYEFSDCMLNEIKSQMTGLSDNIEDILKEET